MHIEDEWETKARKDSGFAVALALANVARALHALGNNNAATSMGALEGLGSDIGQCLNNVASSIGSVADAIDTAGERIADAITDASNLGGNHAGQIPEDAGQVRQENANGSSQDQSR